MPTLFSELRTFVKTHRALMVVPLLLLVLGLIAIIIFFLRGSELAPMIYTTDGGSFQTRVGPA